MLQRPQYFDVGPQNSLRRFGVQTTLCKENDMVFGGDEDKPVSQWFAEKKRLKQFTLRS